MCSAELKQVGEANKDYPSLLMELIMVPTFHLT